MAWNDEAELRCKFTFVCEKQWDELEPTEVDDQRHCARCDQRVYLTESPAQFEVTRAAGRCVAVGFKPFEPVLAPGPPMMVGTAPRGWLPRATAQGDKRAAVWAVAVAAAVIGGLLWWWL
jgi:hypothetical protein